jgi:hypothetical protein
MAVIGNSSTQQAFTPAIDYFSGNGSTTAFTLSRPVASVAQVQVTIDNVAQNPSSAYTVSNNTITFTSAPLSGTNNIYVYYTSPITQVIAPGQGTVTATSFVSSTGTGAGVFQTSPTITTPTINTLTSAAATALALQSAGTTAIYVDTSQNVGIGTGSPTTYDGKTVIVKTSAAAETIPLSLVNASGSAGTSVSLGFAPNTNIDLVRLNAYRTDTAFGGATDLIMKSWNGSSLTEKMRIDSVGRMTLPYQTMFTARSSVSGNIASGATQLVPLNDYFVNIGSCYNNSTYRFTAPIAGQYQLTVTGMLNTGQSSTGNGSIRLRKNGTEFTYTHMNGVHPASACITLIVSASANDYFEFYAENCYYQGATNYITLFSGQLVG